MTMVSGNTFLKKGAVGRRRLTYNHIELYTRHYEEKWNTNNYILADKIQDKDSDLFDVHGPLVLTVVYS